MTQKIEKGKYYFSKKKIHDDKVVNIKVHEGAIVCSFEYKILCDLIAVQKVFECEINSLVNWLNDNKAIIGHIKGNLHEGETSIHYSTVGFDLNIENSKTKEVSVSFAAIIFSINGNELREKVSEIVEKLHGISVQ